MAPAWLARSDSWLAAYTGRLLRILILVQAAALAFVAAGSHGAFAPLQGPPTTTDFASFYTAGRLANAGRAADAYDPAAHRAVEEAVIARGVEEKRFLNPPPFLLICAPLARLPYLPAFLLFEAATALAWLLLASRIAGGAGAAAALAAIPAVWWALGWGQNSFLSAGLMAAATLLLPRRPLLAGAAFGALCFKPHFGLLIPVALLAGRHWRALLAAAATLAGLCALAAACFGLATWRAFFAMVTHARATAETGIALSGHIDLAGAARLAGLPGGPSWVLQAGAAAAAAAAVAWAWQPRRFAAAPACACAVLVAATLAAMPFLLFYDLVMAGTAAAWLMRAMRRGGVGWRPGEPTALAACLAASLVAYPAAALLHLATGTLVAPVILALALGRMRSAAAA